MDKRSLLFPALLAFGIFALYGCVLTPAIHYVAADVVLQNTLWFDLLDLLAHHAEIYGAAVLYGFAAGAVYRFGTKKAKPLFFLAGGALLFKYVGAVAAISIVDRAIDMTGSLNEFLFSFLLDVLLAALVILLAHKLITPAVENHRARRAAAAVLGKDFDEWDGCLPYHGVLKWRNPLQRTLFLGMLILTAGRLIAFTVDYTFGGGLGLADILWMFFYWLILVLLPGFFGYLIALRCAKIIGAP